MKIQLKRAARLHGSDRAKGIHEIPDACAEHWFFQALQKDGDLVILDAAPAAAEPAEIPAEEPVIEAPAEEPELEDVEELPDDAEGAISDEEPEAPVAHMKEKHGKKKKKR